MKLIKQPGVYILQSLKNFRYYIGSTGDITKRLKEHNLGKVKSTKYIAPIVFKTFIPCATLSEARKSEYMLKQYKRKDIIEYVIASKIFPWEYKGG